MVKLTFDNAKTNQSETIKRGSKSRSTSQKKNSSEYFKVDRIVAMDDKGPIVRFLVKWEGYPDSQNTWEPLENLKDCPSVLEEFFSGLNNKSAKRSLSVLKERVSKSRPATKSRKQNPKIIDMFASKERKSSPFSKNLIQIIDQLETKRSGETISLVGAEDKINTCNTPSLKPNPSSAKAPKAVDSLAKKKPLSKTCKAKVPSSNLQKADQKRAKPSKNPQPTLIDIIDYKPSDKSQLSCPNLNSISEESNLNISSTAGAKHRVSLPKGAKTPSKTSHLEIVEKAESIVQHSSENGEFRFKLSWPNNKVSSDVANLTFSYDDVELYNPRLLTSYLRQFIKVNNN